MKGFLLFLCLTFLVLLPACAVETAHAPEDGVAETPTIAPTATLGSNTAVIFKRSGGITGLNEQWTIFTDGRIDTNSPSQPQLSAEEVEQLLNSLESAGFFELDGSYLPEDTCCNRFYYELTAVQNSTFHSVKTLEATPDMPEALQQALRLIQTILFENNNQ